MIQQRKLDEAAFRGERFQDWTKDLKGHNDLLNVTQPAIIEEIHRQYLEAGADVIETNTFNSQAISLADYKMETLGYAGGNVPSGQWKRYSGRSRGGDVLSRERSVLRPRPRRFQPM
jgi:hypothetical protein